MDVEKSKSKGKLRHFWDNLRHNASQLSDVLSVKMDNARHLETISLEVSTRARGRGVLDGARDYPVDAMDRDLARTSLFG